MTYHRILECTALDEKENLKGLLKRSKSWIHRPLKGVKHHNEIV